MQQKYLQYPSTKVVKIYINTVYKVKANKHHR